MLDSKQVLYKKINKLEKEIIDLKVINKLQEYQITKCQQDLINERKGKKNGRARTAKNK